MAAALHDALSAAGLDTATRAAPRALTLPAKALAWAGGTGVGGLVPDDLAMMSTHDLDFLVYPSDVSNPLMARSIGLVGRIVARLRRLLDRLHPG